jgi:hypothetical protein
MSLEDWVIKFWQWLISIPADRNPALDRTGERAGERQFGQPVFNLVFSDVSHGVERKCTLRAGQHILIPINVVEVSFAEFPGARTEEDLHRIAREEFQDACEPFLFLSVNKKEFSQLECTQPEMALGKLEEFRVHTRAFDVNYPDNPIWGLPGPSKAVADGYWVILEGLPEGVHNIHFKASLKNPITGKLFYKDSVKYTITVPKDGF